MRVPDDEYFGPPEPRNVHALATGFLAAIALAVLGSAFALGWLAATVFDPSLVLTGTTHLVGCDP